MRGRRSENSRHAVMHPRSTEIQHTHLLRPEAHDAGSDAPSLLTLARDEATEQSQPALTETLTCCAEQRESGKSTDRGELSQDPGQTMQGPRKASARAPGVGHRSHLECSLSRWMLRVLEPSPFPDTLHTGVVQCHFHTIENPGSRKSETSLRMEESHPLHIRIGRGRTPEFPLAS